MTLKLNCDCANDFASCVNNFGKEERVGIDNGEDGKTKRTALSTGIRRAIIYSQLSAGGFKAEQRSKMFCS
jgi:hypothetical protein